MSGVRERGKSEFEDLQLFCCVNSKSAAEGVRGLYRTMGEGGAT